MHNVGITKFPGKDISVLHLPGINQVKGAAPLTLKSIPYKKSHILKYRTWTYGAGGYEVPEYNLYEVSAAEDGDGIIKQAHKKKIALMFKQGWDFKGQNPKTILYVKERFRQLSLAQRKSMQALLRDVGSDVIRYSNAFLVKVRDDKNSSGKVRTVRSSSGERDLKPVAAYFRIPPETIRIKTDQYGNPVKYLQETPDGRRQEFNAENIIHFTFNRRAGFNIACPNIWPGIEDIRALRRIEEYVELLIEQYLFPLFTLTIGTDEWPATMRPDGTSEIDEWSTKVNNLDIQSGLALSHRTKLDIIGFDKILPVEEYLQYFKKRVYTSLGVSAIDLGETDTSNKSTADNASKMLIDDVKDYQNVFAEQIEFEIIQELLLERFDISVLSEENDVNFTFSETDVEAMIKTENHGALMYNMNYLNQSEARKKANHDPVRDEASKQEFFLHQVDIPKAEAQGKIDQSTKAAVNSSKSKQQPSNQHKTNSGPTKRKSSVGPRESMFLDTILRDFEGCEPDYLKIKLYNWFFTLDHANLTQEVYNDIFLILDSFVQDAYSSLLEGKFDSSTLRETLKTKIITSITQYQEEEE